MTTSPKPAILFVHGAYFLPDMLMDFTQALEAAGFVVSCPHQPTCGDERPPTKGFHDDVAVTRQAAEELQRAGHPIIVLAHSYGGIVATESITPSLYAPVAAATTTTGNNTTTTNANTITSSSSSFAGVVRLIYLSAYLATPGNSMGSIFARHGFQCDVDLGVNEDGTAYAKNQEHAWYNDLPADEAAVRARRVVTHNFALIGDVPVTHSPWRDVPSTYVFCLRDVAIKLPLQRAMVRDAEGVMVSDPAGEGFGFGKVEIDAGHCPFYSKRDEVVGVVRDVWRDFETGSASR